MELMGNLKDKVSKAQSKEEARGLIEKAGMKLSDNELEMVAGGVIHTPSEGQLRAEFGKTVRGRY